jgi:hypothetical protein
MTEDSTKKEDSNSLEMAVDAESHETGYLSHLYYGLRSLYIPTSPFKVLQAQKALLSSFVRYVHPLAPLLSVLIAVRAPIQHKRYQLQSGEYINYIDIVNPGHEQDHRHPITFVMAHGYAAGLALFFGRQTARSLLSSPLSPLLSVLWSTHLSRSLSLCLVCLSVSDR